MYGEHKIAAWLFYPAVRLLNASGERRVGQMMTPRRRIAGIALTFGEAALQSYPGDLAAQPLPGVRWRP